jgi:hypothetical protein
MNAADRPAIVLVRSAAVVQGLALVVIPALSTVMTDKSGLALSATQYGTLFVPQTVLAIVFSLGGGSLMSRLGARAGLTLGFAANLIAMALIAATALLGSDREVSYVVLLAGTAFLGMGFAIVTPTLNVLAGELQPQNADRAILVANALLGGSAVIAPLLSILFIGLGVWWTLPVLCGVGMLTLCAATSRISIEIGTASKSRAKARVPARLWQFIAFAFVYGLCEQLNASWAPLYMSRHLAASASQGLLALAFFWGTATGARVIFALSSAKLKPPVVFCTLPFVLAAAFCMLASLPSYAPGWVGVAAFALAGAGVSALLPLLLSFAGRSMKALATTVTSIVFASYLAGYGAAAFGVGPLQHVVGIASLDAWAVGLALVVATLSIVIVKTPGATT